MLLGLIFILLLILTTGFFVAGEFSIVSVRKTRMEQLASEGSSVAARVKYAIEHLDRYIAAVQIGITLATVGLGALGEPVLAQVFLGPLEQVLPTSEAFLSAHGVAIAFSFLVVTILEIILGEIVPKIVARQRSEKTALFLIRPLNLFVILFRPLIWLVNSISGIVLRLVGLNLKTEHAQVHSVEELEMLVASSRQAGVLDREEEVILRRVFDFGDLTARQVMRPRTEVVAIPINATPSDVMETMLAHNHSRFPVYDGDLDNIVGVVHVKDVFMVLARSVHLHDGDATVPALPPGTPPVTGPLLDGHGLNFAVRSLLRPIEAVPETLDVDELLTRMQQGGFHMAVVIDEYGGTAGIVTLEDMVEEIVGEVRDEFEPLNSNVDIQVTPEGTLIDGLVAIDDVNDVLGLKLDSEADTVGGYVFQRLGRKPELGDEVTSDGHVLRVEELDGLRVSKVRIVPHNRNGTQPPGDDD